jgi:hypothetical protein
MNLKSQTKSQAMDRKKMIYLKTSSKAASAWKICSLLMMIGTPMNTTKLITSKTTA